MATTINASTSAGLVSTADTSGVLQLQAQNTTVLNAELGKALALQGATSTTGCGIAFPSAQVLSSDPNTLDDYEEGTWVAGLTCGTSGTLTVDPAYSTCRYTKVGRSVTISGFIYISAASSPTGTLTLTGLPFTNNSGNGYYSGNGICIYAMNTANNLNGYIAPNSTYITLSTFSAGTRTDAVAGYFGATLGFIINFTYQTS